jgi:hypothetical protein
LLSDFPTAVARVEKEMGGCLFLMVSQRCNLEVRKPIDFSSSSWEPQLRHIMAKRGVMAGSGAIDYFVFTKGLWQDIPPVTIGRVAFDNWLIYEARRLGVKVIDATPSINIIHQHHVFSVTNESSPKVIDKAAFDEWFWERRKSPEALEQVRLLGGKEFLFTIDDANCVLKQEVLAKQNSNIKKIKKLIFAKVFKFTKKIIRLTKHEVG